MIIKNSSIFIIVILTSLTFTASPKSFFQRKPKLPLACDEAKKIMDDVYNGMSGFGLNENESNLITQHGGNATYGEILCDSLKTLLEEAKLTKNDTFYDLGGGIGKACMQVALTTPARAISVELAPSRAEKARSAKRLIAKKHNIKLGNKLEIVEQNFLATKFAKNSVIYMCATCYSDALLQHVVQEAKNIEGGARVFSLKQLPGCQAIKTYTLPMTWTSGTNVYYYEFGKETKETEQKAA